MKKIIAFLILICFGYAARAQHWVKVYSYNEYLGLTADSVLIPPQDTTFSNPTVGSLAIFNGHVYQRLSTAWSQVDGGGNAVQSLTGSQSIQYGAFNSMPSPGTPGRFYATTDSSRWYFDNGTAWLNLSGSGGGGGGSLLTFGIGIKPGSYNGSSAVTINADTIAMTTRNSLDSGLATKQTNALSPGDVWIGNGSGVAQQFAVTGDFTFSSSGVGTINANSVTLAKQAQAPANTIPGNNTGGTANLSYLSTSQIMTMLNAVSNFLGVQQVGYGLYASHPTGSQTVLYFASDSTQTGGLFYWDGSAMHNLTPQVTLSVRGLGQPGDTIMITLTGTVLTGFKLNVAAMRDSTGSCVHHVFNPDGSLTIYSTCTVLNGTGYVKMSGTTPAYQTNTQLTADVNTFGTSTSGAVPAPGSVSGKVLSDAGTWVVNGSGGSTTFQGALTNGRSLANSDSINLNGHTLHDYGGRNLLDSVYINVTTAPAPDTVRNVGTSYTYGVGAPSFATDYATVLDSLLAMVQDNHGISGLTLQNDAPTNPWGAANNGVADTVNIPLHTATRPLVTLEYGINDYRWIGTNWDTAHFHAEYNEVIQAYLNRGYTVANLVLFTPVVLGQGQYNADSAAHSFSSACTPARALTYVVTVKNIGAQWHIPVVDINAAFTAFGTPLLLASDSIHPGGIQGHLFMAQAAAAGIGPTLLKQNQQLAVGAGLTEVDSLKIRNLGPTTSNSTPLVASATGHVYSCANCFPWNNQSAQQPWVGNVAGLQTGFSYPGYLVVTGLRPQTGVAGFSTNTNGIQFEYGSGTGYIDSYNYLTSSFGTVNIGYKGGNLLIGSGASRHNTAIADVNGIFNNTGAAHLNSTNGVTGWQFLNGFQDYMANAPWTMRTNAGAATNLEGFTTGNIGVAGWSTDYGAYAQFPAATSSIGQLYLRPSAGVGPSGNDFLWADSVNSALYFRMNGTLYNILSGGGGGGLSGSGTAGYLPIWNTSSSLSNSNIYSDGSKVTIKSGSWASYFGNLNSVVLRGAEVLAVDSGGGFMNVGSSMAQANSAVFQVNGSSTFASSAFFGTSGGVRIFNSFIDQMGASTDISFRTASASLYNMVMFHSGRDGFGSSTDQGTAENQATSTTLPQFAAHYDATHYTTLGTGSTGIYTITPTGITTKFTASTTGGATINIPGGATPTSPNDGDVWNNSTSHHLFTRLNGTTYQLDQQSATGSAGQYVPTITNISNASSITADSANWSQVGNIVTVYGQATLTPISGSSTTQVSISLPVASLLNGGNSCWGTAVTSTSFTPGVIFTYASNHMAELTFASTSLTSSITVYYSFSYQVQ